MSIWHTARFVRKGNYLNGSFIKLPDVDGYINSLNPGDHRDTIGKFPFSETGADIAVGCARQALPGWHRLGLEARKAALLRYKTQLETSQELLSLYLTRETGKPLWETRSEVAVTIRQVDVTLEQGLPQLEPWRLHDIDGGCEYHPRGVVAVIGSFNLPLLAPNTHIIPALLAGNTVVFKPSKYTPALGQLISEMLDRARLPRGVFNLVQGNGATVGKRLVLNPDVDAIHLEGAVDTGLEIKQLTLHQPWKRLVLNTCGRGTAIVLDDADLDKAAHEIIAGAYLTAGQRRSSTARVIATKGIAPKLAMRLKQVMRRISIGYGLYSDVFSGPLISEKYRKVFLAYQEAIEQEGHEILVRGERLDLEPNGFYVKPALIRILPEIRREAPSSELIVGPALELQVAEDFQHAVQLHNESRLGLVTSLFTKRADMVTEARYALRVGALNVNRSTLILSTKLPLEGQSASGNGLPGGIFAVRSVSFPQAWIEDHHPFDRNTIMPGLKWPEFSVDDDDSPTRILKQEPAPEEDMGEMTISDLLIPQDDEVTPVLAPSNAAQTPAPAALHEPPWTPEGTHARAEGANAHMSRTPDALEGPKKAGQGRSAEEASSSAASGPGAALDKSDLDKSDLDGEHTPTLRIHPQSNASADGKSAVTAAPSPGVLEEPATRQKAESAAAAGRSGHAARPSTAPPAYSPPPVEDEDALDETLDMLPPLPPLPPLPEFDMDGMMIGDSVGASDASGAGFHASTGAGANVQPRVVINSTYGRQPVIDEDEITPPMGMAPIKE